MEKETGKTETNERNRKEGKGRRKGKVMKGKRGKRIRTRRKGKKRKGGRRGRVMEDKRIQIPHL